MEEERIKMLGDKNNVNSQPMDGAITLLSDEQKKEAGEELVDSLMTWGTKWHKEEAKGMSALNAEEQDQEMKSLITWSNRWNTLRAEKGNKLAEYFWFLSRCIDLVSNPIYIILATLSGKDNYILFHFPLLEPHPISVLCMLVIGLYQGSAEIAAARNTRLHYTKGWTTGTAGFALVSLSLFPHPFATPPSYILILTSITDHPYIHSFLCHER